MFDTIPRRRPDEWLSQVTRANIMLMRRTSKRVPVDLEIVDSQMERKNVISSFDLWLYKREWEANGPWPSSPSEKRRATLNTSWEIEKHTWNVFWWRPQTFQTGFSHLSECYFLYPIFPRCSRNPLMVLRISIFFPPFQQCHDGGLVQIRSVWLSTGNDDAAFRWKKKPRPDAS